MNAAYWCRTSVNAIIEEGERPCLARLKKSQNKGMPFAPRPAE